MFPNREASLVPLLRRMASLRGLFSNACATVAATNLLRA